VSSWVYSIDSSCWLDVAHQLNAIVRFVPVLPSGKRATAKRSETHQAIHAKKSWSRCLIPDRYLPCFLVRSRTSFPNKPAIGSCNRLYIVIHLSGLNAALNRCLIAVSSTPPPTFAFSFFSTRNVADVAASDLCRDCLTSPLFRLHADVLSALFRRVSPSSALYYMLLYY